MGKRLRQCSLPSEVYLPDFWDESSNSEWIEANIANIYKRTPNPTWYSTLAAYIAETAESIYTNATATAEWATDEAKTKATLTPRPSATALPNPETHPDPIPFLYLTSSPSSTLTPSLTSTPDSLTVFYSHTLYHASGLPNNPAHNRRDGKQWTEFAGLFVAAGVIGLVAGGYLVVRILQKRRRK